jgi:hypothetical protein
VRNHQLFAEKDEVDKFFGKDPRKVASDNAHASCFTAHQGHVRVTKETCGSYNCTQKKGCLQSACASQCVDTCRRRPDDTIWDFLLAENVKELLAKGKQGRTICPLLKIA